MIQEPQKPFLQDPERPNDLHVALQGINSFSPWPGMVSSPRAAMRGQHLSQSVVIAGSQPPLIQTGVEFEFSKFTFAQRFMQDCTVIRVIERYQDTESKNGFKFSPERVIIYQTKDQTYGVMRCHRYHSLHPQHGYVFKPNAKTLERLRPGEIFRQGELLADSPSVQADGNYAYGLNLKTCYLSDKAVNEDGFKISRDVLDRLSFNTFEQISCDYGMKYYAKNMYGTPDHFKAFPDLGDKIRRDKLVMALSRPYQGMSPCEQSRQQLCQHDPIFDRSIYSDQVDGTVIDIRVYYDPNLFARLLVGMDDQFRRYLNGMAIFYQEIEMEYRRIARQHPVHKSLQITPEFSQLLIEAYGFLDRDLRADGEQIDARTKLSREHKRQPLDCYRVEFTIMYTSKPNHGFKITDGMGSKGVICEIAEPEEMPVDQYGQRADLVVYSQSCINRANPARLAEQYLNSNSVALMKSLEQRLGLTRPLPPRRQLIAYLETHPEFTSVYARLIQYYRTFQPAQGDLYAKLSDSDQKEHLAYALLQAESTGGISFLMPPDNPKNLINGVREHESYPDRYRLGPVTFKNKRGETITTKHPARVGSVYHVLLDKITMSWNVVSSARLQGFGIIARLNSHQHKHAPLRLQGVRIFGESEMRIIIGHTPWWVAAEIIDLNNNAITHREACYQFLSQEKPSYVEKLIDRDVYRYNGSACLLLVKHILQCGGVKLVYQKDTWTAEQGPLS